MKYLLAGVASMASIISAAQDSAQKGNLTITGSMDIYYRYNFLNAKDSGRTNNLTSFTNSQNSFELGMASIKAAYSIGKVEGVADLGFGRRAEEFSYNDGDLDQGKNGFLSLPNIKQAYISYAPSSKVRFNMGKWFTHVGYEVPDAYVNRNYSMDYMFSYGPFFHTGIKMDVTLNGNFAFMIGVANPTDHSTASFAKKTLIAQVHLITTDTKVNAYLNYVGGKDLSDAMINQFDVVVTGTISSKFHVGYNGTLKNVKPLGVNSASWWGSALYLNFDPTSILGLTLRGEYFDDDKGVAGIGTAITDVTLSGNIRISNLTIIPECRLDIANAPLFFKNSDTFAPTSKSSGAFLLAATYHF
jgi:hypothetical protein